MWNTCWRATAVAAVLLTAPVVGQAAQTKPPAATPQKVDKAAAAQAHAAKAYELFQAGQMDKARIEVEKALKMNPRSSVAYSVRAMIRMNTKDLDGALADLTTAQGISPADSHNYFLAAVIHMQREDLPRALTSATKAADLAPDDAMAQALRIVLLGMTGDMAQAEEKAVAWYAAQPNSAEAAGALMGVYEDTNRYDKAIDIGRMAVTRHPDNVGLIDSLTGYLTGCKGTATSCDAQRTEAGALYGKAIAAIRAAVARQPGNVEWLDDLGQRLTECKDTTVPCATQRAEALEVYGKAIALKPTADLYVRRSQTRPLTDRDGKFADLDAALALEPASEFIVVTRGATYYNYKEYDKALVDINAALAMDPEDDEALSLRVRLHERNGNVDGQLQDLDVLNRLRPEAAEYFNTACWLRATHQRELDKALEQCNAALKLKPGDRVMTDSRAMVYLQMGKWDEAIADYDVAMAGNTYAIGLYGRGIARLRKGDKKQAKADIKAARKMDKTIETTFAGYGIGEKPKGEKPKKMKAGKRL